MDSENIEDKQEIQKINIQEDCIGLTDSVSISVYRTGFLKPCAKKLAKMAEKANEEMQCYAASAILMSAAAVEASILQFAHINEKDIYIKNRFTRAGVGEQYRRLFNKELEDDFPDVDELIGIRNTIVHNEPDHKSGRELTLGNKLTGDYARRATEIADKFIKNMLGEDITPKIK